MLFFKYLRVCFGSAFLSSIYYLISARIPQAQKNQVKLIAKDVKIKHN